MENDLKFLKCVISYRKPALEFYEFNRADILDSKYVKFGKYLLDSIKLYQQVPSLDVLKKTVKDEMLQKYMEDSYNEVIQSQIEEKDFQFYFSELKSRYKKKKIDVLKEDLQNSSNKPVKELEAKIRDTFITIQQTDVHKSSESRTLKDNIALFLTKFKETKNAKTVPGIPTKYSFFDENVVLGAGDMVIIGADTNGGKSTLMTNMAVQMWMQDNKLDTDPSEYTKGYNCVIFSIEMPYDNYFLKVLSCISAVEYKRIERATLNKEEVEKVKKALDFIKNYPYELQIVDIPELCSSEIDIILENIEECKFKPDFVAVDYIGIMSPNDKQNKEADWLKQDTIAKELRTVFRRRSIPGLTAIQLGRKKDTKNADENIGTQRVARSLSVLTHCTTYLQIEQRPNEDKCPDMRVHIIKNRNGGKGVFTLMKDLKCSRLEDINLSSSDNDQEKFLDYDNIDADSIEELEL